MPDVGNFAQQTLPMDGAEIPQPHVTQPLAKVHANDIVVVLVSGGAQFLLHVWQVMEVDEVKGPSWRTPAVRHQS